MLGRAQLSNLHMAALAVGGINESKSPALLSQVYTRAFQLGRVRAERGQVISEHWQYLAC